MFDIASYLPPSGHGCGDAVISTAGDQSIGVPLYKGGFGSPSGVNYVTANLAVFIPFGVPEAVTVTKLWFSNGAAVAGLLDVAIYDPAGTRLVSTGSTGQSGTNRIQVVDVGDIALGRGVYYLAISSDTSGATQKVFAAAPAAAIGQAMGLLQQASAFVLPATATFAAFTSAFVPLCGLQGYRTVGP